MAPEKDKPLRKLRLAVAAADGRRSSTWLAIVNKNDVYLSSLTMMGQIKVSLHASGFCKQGFTQRVHEALPEGPERAALDTWHRRKGQPGVPEPAYLVYLAGSELRNQDEGVDPCTVVIPCTGDDREIALGFFLVEPPLPEAQAYEPMRHLGRLPRADGSAVDVLCIEQPREDSRIEDALHMHYGGATRELPMVLSTSQQFGYATGRVTGGPLADVRYATEVAIDPTREVRLVRMRDGILEYTGFQAPVGQAGAREIRSLGRKYARIQSEFLTWIEPDGPPLYLEEGLSEVAVSASAPLGHRDVADVAREVHLDVTDQAELRVQRDGAQSLGAISTLTLPGGLVAGFCLLAVPEPPARA